jgi:hypothetical protein
MLKNLLDDYEGKKLIFFTYISNDADPSGRAV